MPELLKDLYSKALIDCIAEALKQHYPEFKTTEFNQQILANGWHELALKARMRRVSCVMGQFLPTNYDDALAILLPASQQFTGLQHMCFTDFVEVFGLKHFKSSLHALEVLTPNSSAEFAIRPFIINYPVKTMLQMLNWSKSNNHHLRRLASEGCRPRLPWAMALPEYKEDPSAVLKVILNLIDDESLYVRRSVANNLNDISKDNPQMVIDIAEEHLGQSKNVDWVIKHACRSLLKKGDKRVLGLFSYANASHVSVNHFRVPKKVVFGDKLHFEFELVTDNKQLGRLRIEFVIDFMKKNGKTSPKIFKISEGLFNLNCRKINKYFSFKAISTRQYYAGQHYLHIVVNGDRLASQSFELS